MTGVALNPDKDRVRVGAMAQGIAGSFMKSEQNVVCVFGEIALDKFGHLQAGGMKFFKPDKVQLQFRPHIRQATFIRL